MNDIDFERIYNAYAGDVWRVCVCYFGSCRADAEDASQITFTKLLTSPPDTDDIQRIKGWLLVTAGNVCKDMLRSRHRRNIPLDSLAAIAVIVSISIMLPLFLTGDDNSDMSYGESSVDIPSDGSDMSYAPSDDDSTPDYSVPPIDEYVMSNDKLQMVSKFYDELAAQNPDIHDKFFELYDTFAIELFSRCAQSGKKTL